jgi:hypothetical protein
MCQAGCATHASLCPRHYSRSSARKTASKLHTPLAAATAAQQRSSDMQASSYGSKAATLLQHISMLRLHETSCWSGCKPAAAALAGQPA